MKEEVKKFDYVKNAENFKKGIGCMVCSLSKVCPCSFSFLSNTISGLDPAAETFMKDMLGVTYFRTFHKNRPDAKDFGVYICIPNQAGQTEEELFQEWKDGLTVDQLESLWKERVNLYHYYEKRKKEVNRNV